ncbi:unnamed protein product [Closterium sp. Yama58-4]|nr:unnamed protein product [Closterium sp. Yama58-4]
MIANASSSSSYEFTRHQNGVTDPTFETSESSSAHSWKENGVTDRIVCFLEGLGSPSGCRHEDFRLQNGQEAFRGLHSDWVTNELLACARPTDAMIAEGLADRFAERGIRLIVNLEVQMGAYGGSGGICGCIWRYRAVFAGNAMVAEGLADRFAERGIRLIVKLEVQMGAYEGSGVEVQMGAHGGSGGTDGCVWLYRWVLMEEPGEHPWCGSGITASGFSYTPDNFIKAGVGYLHAPWKDMACPPFPTMLSIVQSISLAIGRRHKVAVHCHAGLGRTGLVIACYLVAANSLSAADAVAVVRAMRHLYVEMLSTGRKNEPRCWLGNIPQRVHGCTGSRIWRLTPAFCVLFVAISAARRAKERNVGDVEEHSGIRLRNRFISAPQLRQKLADIRFLRLEAISYVHVISSEYCDRHIAAAYQRMKPTRLELDGGNLSTAFLYRNNVRRSRQVLLSNGTCGSSGSSSRRGARPVAALDQDALRSILKGKENLTSRPVSQGKRFLAAASGDEEQAPYVPPLKRAKGVENGTVGGETIGGGSRVTVGKATGRVGLSQEGSMKGGIKEGVDVGDGHTGAASKAFILDSFLKTSQTTCGTYELIVLIVR